MKKQGRHSFLTTLRYILLVCVITLGLISIIGTGGGGGGGGGSSDGGSTTSIFPSSDDEEKDPEGTTTVTLSSGIEVTAAEKQVIVRLEDTATRDDYEDLISFLEARGYSKVGQIPALLLIQVEVPTNGEITSAISDLEALSYVEDARPNILHEPLETDPSPSSFNGSDNWIDDIRARQAWDITTGSVSVKIGIVDDGIYIPSGHISADRLIPLYQGVISGYHGTAVAALAGADGNDGSGMCGIAWNSPIMFFDAANHVFDGFFEWRIVRGVKDCIENGAKVVNVSIGNNQEENQSAEDFYAEQRAYRKGIREIAEYADNKTLIVLAAGNSRDGDLDCDNSLFPDNMDNKEQWEALWEKNIIIVTDSAGNQTLGWQVQGEVVDLAAPAFCTSLAQLDGSVLDGNEVNNGWNGSSYAAPLVTGAAALILSENPNLSPVEVKTILKETAQENDGDIGILDLYAALTDPRVNGSSETEEVEAAYNQMKTEIETEDLTGLMSLYNDNYLHDGDTKSDMQTEWTGMFAAYSDITVNYQLSDIVINGENATVTETVTIQGIYGATGETSTYHWSETAYWIKVGSEWQYYGNQEPYDIDVILCYFGSSGQYWTEIFIEDAGQDITALSVTGSGISGSLSLSDFNYSNGGWHSDPNVYMGDTGSQPTPPLTYSLTITDDTGVRPTRTVMVKSRVDSFATNASPSKDETVSGTFTFTWTGISSADLITYRIELYDSVGNKIGDSPHTANQSITYFGSALADGSYYYYVVAIDKYGNQSLSEPAHFQYQN